MRSWTPILIAFGVLLDVPVRASEADGVSARQAPWRLTLLGGAGLQGPVSSRHGLAARSIALRIDAETGAPEALKAKDGSRHFVSGILSLGGAVIDARDLDRHRSFVELQLVPGVRWTVGGDRGRMYLDVGLGGFFSSRTQLSAGGFEVRVVDEPELNFLGRVGLGLSFDVGEWWAIVVDVSGHKYFGPRSGGTITGLVGVSFSFP